MARFTGGERGRQRRAGRGLSSYLPATIAVIGILVTLLAAAAFAKAPGVYWSRLQVRLLPPAIDSPDGLPADNASLTVAAGVVAKMLEPDATARVSSDTTTLVGRGARHGYSVVLPNSGGQWATEFSDPVLDVQVVGTTGDEVTAQMTRLLGLIDTSLRNLQDHYQVNSTYRIRSQLSPPTPPLFYEHGSRSRAGAATLLLGLCLTMTGWITAKRVVRGRRPVPVPGRPTAANLRRDVPVGV